VRHALGQFNIRMVKTYLTSILIVLQIALGIDSRAQGNSLSDAQPADIAKKLDIYLTSAKEAFRFNGSVLIAQKGNILLQKGYGWRNAFTRSANKSDTRFPILSITKPFTATIILKLQEEGKLSVWDNLAKYLPDYPNGNKIKIHYLLTHSSGIYNYTEPVAIEDSALVNYPISKQKVLDIFVNAPVEFAPGKGYSYNNSGYFLLGLIIEKVTGKAYETVVRELIFGPLGMTNSGFDFLSLPDSLKAKGYEFLDSERTVPYKHYDSTFAYSAGSIYSTIGDMYKWARAISSQQILTADSWKLAFTPQVRNYGYGWMTGQFLKRQYIRHSGGYPGYMSEFIYYPEEDFTIILLNNFGTYDQNVWAVGMGIASIAFDQPYDHWKIRKLTKIDKEILLRYAGIYESTSKRKLVIELQGDRIFTNVPGLPAMELYSESDSVFYLGNFNTEYKFITNDIGKVLKLTIHEHGQDYQLKKVQ
jgi:CubicO group peptidase (beta-lactamase class C family)